MNKNHKFPFNKDPVKCIYFYKKKIMFFSSKYKSQKFFYISLNLKMYI